jgi:predicted ATPase
METNNWYVLTGAPCSGKTTLINLLSEMGYQVVPELARVYIDQELAKGVTLAELRQDELGFQKKILQCKIDHEKTLSPEAVIFFDRAIPDSDAYYKLCGVKPDETLKKALAECSYKKVFLLDFLKYKKDYARTESEEEQRKLHEYLADSYTELNIPLIRIPEIPKTEIAKRLQIILDNL